MTSAAWLVALTLVSSTAVHPASARSPAPLHTAAALAGPVRVNDVCQQAIRAVQARGSLPANLLNAIGLVESGRLDPLDRTVKPWPWSINAEGQGTMFPTKEDALAGVAALRSRGVLSIDVGCMQVNLAYHPDAFGSLDEAFDPTANVAYAARFLSELHAQTADWDLAAAYYHSRTLDLGAPYQQKVAAAMGGARPILPPPPPRNKLALAWASTMTTPGFSGPAASDPWPAAAGAPRPDRVRLAAAGQANESRQASLLKAAHDFRLTAER